MSFLRLLERPLLYSPGCLITPVIVGVFGMETPGAPRNVKEPSLVDAILPIVMLITGVAGSVYLFGADAVTGPVQVALIMTALVTALILMKNGHPWQDVATSAEKAVGSVVTAIFILFSVGALIGTWNMSGTIPTMIVYGLKVLNPSYFYVASAVVCGVTSIAIGSAWTTAGTIGAGLIGMATVSGASPTITAGAVISGAYLGDKLSPLSETTVLTAQLVGIDVYKHIRWMMWTAGPAFLIALVLFAILGVTSGVTSDASPQETASELSRLNELFYISPLNLLPVLLLVVLAMKKVPATLAITSSALLAGIMAVLFQGPAVARFVNDSTLPAPVAGLKAIWSAMATGFSANTGIAELDQLLSRGGMDSMLLTLWIIVGAVTLGSLLEEFGLIGKILDPLVARAKTTFQLISTVVATCLGLNIVTADQYIALVLPARIFRVEFPRRGLALENLSRTCADAGTVTSPLVPWNSCGAYMASVLGVSTLWYLPFCFFNFLCPLMALFYGFTGIKIEHLNAEEAKRDRPHDLPYGHPVVSP